MRERDATSMQPVVATFAKSAEAASIAQRLRVTFGVPQPDISLATAAAYGEPYDGHTLVAAWVADDIADAVRQLLAKAGGELHPQPWAPRGESGDISGVARADHPRDRATGR